MQTLRWIATALFIASVPVFLLFSNVRVAAMEPRVSEYSFDQYDVETVTGVDRAQLDRAAREIARYFRNDQELLTSRVVVNGQEQALFSPREVLHMRDVKDLFQLTFRLHEIAFVYIVAYVAAVFLWSRERSIRRLAQQAMLAGIVTAGVLAAAAVSVLVGFDTLFREFHVLSFSNDFWELDPERDRLIQMYPQGFWFQVTLAVGLVTIAEAALLTAASYSYLRRDSRRRESALSGADPVRQTAGG